VVDFVVLETGITNNAVIVNVAILSQIEIIVE